MAEQNGVRYLHHGGFQVDRKQDAFLSGHGYLFFKKSEQGRFLHDGGIYDLAGNVAEWAHDFYEIPNADAVVDPLGPETGEYRVIRGSSWMHGTITDLRISFRDYGLDGRQDLGFRVARFAEPN